jgi:hypothetical protein
MPTPGSTAARAIARELPGRFELQVGRDSLEVRGLLDLALLEQLGAEGRDRDGRVLQALLAAPRGDDDLLDGLDAALLFLGCWLVRRGCLLFVGLLCQGGCGQARGDENQAAPALQRHCGRERTASAHGLSSPASA